MCRRRYARAGTRAIRPACRAIRRSARDRPKAVETAVITNGVDDDGAARLLERLLTDAELRARFRRDPAAVAREAHLDELAGDFSTGSAMETLEPRESRSSLAGVMMAAAVEGLAGIGLAHPGVSGGHHLSPEVHRVLARHQDVRAAELATPEGAAASAAEVAPSPGHPNDAGVFPAIEPDHAPPDAGTDPADGTDVAEDGGSGDTEADADQEGDGGDDEGGDAEGGDSEDDDDDEPDEDEPDDSNDLLDETTHDNDSSGDSGDAGDDSSAPAPPAGRAAAPPDDSALDDTD